MYLIILFDEPVEFAHTIGLVFVVVAGLLNSLSYKKVESKLK